MAIERNIVNEGGELREVTKPRKTRKPRTKRVAQEAVVVETPSVIGRPTVYTPELGDMICERISLGESLRKICREDGTPGLATIMRWLVSDDAMYVRFREQYARAKEVQADSYEDMMLDIANNQDDVNRARLIIDTMKWTASKLKPKKYGDKIDMTTNGKDIPAPLFGGKSVNAD